MSANHAQANAEIILALSKMGIYMERNRAKLSALSPAAQNTRLRKVFDRAVENCCILPLLFDKDHREAGKLVLGDLPEWTGWRISRKGRLALGMDNFVRNLGTHSLWAPFRMGRYSVTESALVQGASVRLKDDILDMESLLLRWLIFITPIDLLGTDYPGGFWSLGDSSRVAASSVRTACLAVQPLDVFEVQLPDDIDDVNSESEEPEMKQAGYRVLKHEVNNCLSTQKCQYPSHRGNDNRRAIPIIVVRLGSQKNVKTLIEFAHLGGFDPVNTHLTPAHLVIFSRLLESNSRRLAPSEVVKYQERVPKHIAKGTKISFFSPLYCPGANLADQLEIGRVTYCSTEHQSADWPTHKAVCRSKTPKTPIGIRANPAVLSSSIVKVLLPLEYRSQSDNSFGPKFVNYVNPAERLKPPRKLYEKPQPAKTVYAHGERFIVRARWGGHADRMFGVHESDRRSGNIAAADKEQQGFLDFFMSVLHFVDRPLTCGILLQKQTGCIGTTMVLGPNMKFEDDVDNSPIFDTVVDIIKRSPKDKGEAAYFWATRKGDCIEVDLTPLSFSDAIYHAKLPPAHRASVRTSHSALRLGFAQGSSALGGAREIFQTLRPEFGRDAPLTPPPIPSASEPPLCAVFTAMPNQIPTNLSNESAASSARQVTLVAVSTGGAIVLVFLVFAVIFFRVRSKQRRKELTDTLLREERKGKGAGEMGMLDSEFESVRGRPSTQIAYHLQLSPDIERRAQDPAEHEPASNTRYTTLPPFLFPRRTSDCGSAFREEVWPPPRQESVFVDPLLHAPPDDLSRIVTDIMGQPAGAASAASLPAYFSGTMSPRSRRNSCSTIYAATPRRYSSTSTPTLPLSTTSGSDDDPPWPPTPGRLSDSTSAPPVSFWQRPGAPLLATPARPFLVSKTPMALRPSTGDGSLRVKNWLERTPRSLDRTPYIARRAASEGH
ncbi:hypothetical protein B0H17DRAFT_1134493 [Mycena rosella]|uniref:MYND-type domain-containing protein n=1 Tax=Mycena rosella TaxID=1033263 RepID=A0AAD7DFP9_MYCRO|nr:hypothetical protein B0H17DRAFT_1134493 [Mycena rosella]